MGVHLKNPYLHRKMKTKSIIIILLLFSFLGPIIAQGHLQFGVRSNIGLFGIKYPRGYELINETLLRKDDYYQYANIAFSGGILMDYTFYKKKDFSMALQAELDYTYTSFKKEWGFQRGFDASLTTYTVDQQVIHKLKAFYLSLPIRGSMQYKKWKGSIGVVGSRVFSATIDRNFRTRSGRPLGEWVDNETHWRSTKKANGDIKTYVPYLSHYYSWQGIMSLEYQLTKNIFIGLEGRRFYHAPSLSLFVNSDDAQVFFFKGDMLSLSFLYIK